MKTKFRLKSTAARRGALLSLPLLAAVASPGFALDVYLKTGTTTITPSGAAAPITMWGYQSCTDNTFATCDPISVPGPAISVPATDATGLIVHLSNTLPEPTSIVIDSLPMPTGSAPVWDDGTSGNRTSAAQRVRSLTTEAAAITGTATYTWPAVKPGTFLYRSGTHMQVQDQMGLYGAVTKNTLDPVAAVGTTPATAGQAYGASSTFDKDVTLLYSEIDPVIHNAVATGNFGLNPPTGSCTAPVSAPNPLPANWVCSTVNYAPKYFLINGQAYNGTGTNEYAAAGVGQKTLLRFLNAGLETHVPVINGLDMILLAEDANLYPFAKTQYSAFLPAMKTMDAIIEPQSSAKLSIMDGMLNLSNNGAGPGGMLAFLTPGAGTQPTFALTGCLPGPKTAINNAAFSCTVTATDSTGGTAVTYSLVSGPAGMVVDGAGLISWNPATPAGSSNAVTVQAADTATPTNVKTATFTVNVQGNAPTAVADSYSVVLGQPLTELAATGVLANDTPSGALTAALVSAPPAAAGSLTLNSDGSFTFVSNPSFTGASTSFTYKAIDSAQVSEAVQTVTITITNTAPITDTEDYIDIPASTAYVVSAANGVLTGDSDPEGRPLTAVLVSQPAAAAGTVVLNANGGFTYNPAASFVGTATFTYRANDGVNNSAPTSVNLTVVNTAPVAVDDGSAAAPLAVTRNRSLVISVLANDTDGQNNINPAAVARVIQALHGSTLVNANGTITYTPALNYVGTDSFTYHVTDKVGAVSNDATVSLCVGACPAADSYAAPAGSPANFNVVLPGVLTNDIPATGTRTATLVASSLRRNGSTTLLGTTLRCPTPNPGSSTTTTKICANGAFRLNLPTLAANRPGTYTFQYTLAAGGGTSAPVTVTITVP